MALNCPLVRLIVASLVLSLIPLSTSTWRIPLIKRELNTTKRTSTSSLMTHPLPVSSSISSSSPSMFNYFTSPMQATESPPWSISPSVVTSKINYVKPPTVKKSSLLTGGGFDYLLKNTSCLVKMNTLMCDSLKLTELPTSMTVPETIEFLDFRNNRIRRLHLGTFYSGPKVKSIFLANNALSHIKANTFANLTNLTHLDLSHNTIVHIEDYAFNGLQMLNVIDLGYNRLQNLSKQIFAQTDGKFFLKELRLNHNELREFEYDAFHHLFYIDALDLEDNVIETLPENVFSLNTRLRDLKLSMNHFKHVPSLALRMASVEILDLSSNRFRELTHEDFKSLKTLSRLRISRVNSLEKIRDYAFADLINLRQLYIEYNRKLREISAKAFVSGKLISQNFTCNQGDSGTGCAIEAEEVEEEDEDEEVGDFHDANLTNSTSSRRKVKYAFDLTEISLKGNALTTLTRETLPWHRIEEIDLSDNPWRCDCHLNWIVNITVNERTDEQFICKKPYKHFNQRISDMTKYDFTCSLFENDVFIVGGVLLMIILATGLTSIGFLINKLKIIPKIFAYIHYPKGNNANQSYVRVDPSSDSVMIQLEKSAKNNNSSSGGEVDENNETGKGAKDEDEDANGFSDVPLAGPSNSELSVQK